METLGEDVEVKERTGLVFQGCSKQKVSGDGGWLMRSGKAAYGIGYGLTFVR